MPPNFRQVLFSTEGRISRSQLWLKGFLPIIAFYILGISIVVGVLVVGVARGTLSEPTMVFVFSQMPLIFFLVAVWPFTAVLVKRIHDRNKSGWLVLAYLAPAILQIILDFRSDLDRAFVIALTGDPTLGQDSSTVSTILDWIQLVVEVWFFVVEVWFFIEFGCMRGTVGANRYGPDPVPHA